MDVSKCCGVPWKDLKRPWCKEPMCSTCENCKRCCFKQDTIKCPSKELKKRYETKPDKRSTKTHELAASDFAFLDATEA